MENLKLTKQKKTTTTDNSFNVKREESKSRVFNRKINTTQTKHLIKICLMNYIMNHSKS